METAIALVILCGVPILLALVGALGGFIGGKISSKVLKEIHPEAPKAIHAKLIKRSTLGFLIGFIVGGIPMGIGLASAAVTPFVNLSCQWVLFVAIGLSLMGIIGISITSPALFGDVLENA